MNYPRTNRAAIWLCLVAAVLLISRASAQTAPAGAPRLADSGQTITLAAFEVSTDRDVGYTASSALAGGRIDTLLKETPSAITVLTAEFLEDIASTNIGTAADWAPNSIYTGEQSTTGDYSVNIRGVGNSFPSRNYFRWYVSSDSYNTERLEFARGPNSILFGDGNPGGINTTFTKQALFVSRRSVQLRADSFGGYRASFDYNIPAGQRFAVRINALADTLKGWRDYDEPTRHSAHLATTFRVAKETQLRGEYEQGKYRRFSFATSFVDQSSNWNRTASYNGVTAPSTTGTGVARYNSGAADDYLVYDPSQSALGIVNWRNFFQSTGTGLRIIPDEPRTVPRFPTVPNREFSLQPPDAYVDTTYHSWTFYLEHRLQAGIIAQLAFNHQDQYRIGNFRVWDQHRIDVNTVLPNGAPNPNFGKAFSDVQPQRTVQENTLTDWRLSLAYKKQIRWVRQSFSLSSGIRHDEFSPVTWTAGRVNNAANVNSQAATNVVRIRQYWDAPRNPAGFDTLLSNGYDVRFIETNTSDEDQNLQYNQLASASTFFNGKLSALLGYRYDTHKRKQQRRVAGNPDGSSILGATDGPGTLDRSKVSVGTSSAGLVFFPVPWLGAYANYSESFNAPGSGASQLDGKTIPPASNEGIDVGLKIEFFGGKIAGTLGYYKMQQIDRARTGDAMADINEIWADLGLPQNQILAYRDLETYKGDGYELDLTANLTRSWRLMLNYSLPKTQQADIGPGLRAYAAEHMAEWQAGASNPALPNATRINTNINDINRTISGYTEGRTLNGTVKQIANLYTTYSFREGRLKGFALGGGANYRGKQVVGNVANQPFNYLYAKPYTIVSAHTSYDLRIGKTRTRLQLNVSNLLDEDDVVYTAFTSNAAAGGDVPNTFRYQTPRKYSLSATFNF
jgi:outer membrane receptor protein involved in Fe transport